MLGMVGMSMAKEYYILWRLAHYFVTVEQYRIIKVGSAHDEIWLEKQEDKENPIIRLLAKNFDWSNLMQKDIDFVAFNAEKIRKQLKTKSLTIKNIYISSLVPVDEFEYRLNKEYKLNPSFKGSTYSVMLHTAHDDLEEKVEQVFEKSINLSIPENVEMQHVEGMKTLTLAEAAKVVKKAKSIFEQVKKPYVTYFFMTVCIIMFVLMEIFGSSENTQTLIEFGATFNVAIEAGEWWRLITPIFLHIGFLHLIMNVFSLYYIGTMVEKLYGHWRYTVIFLVSGIVGCLASFLTNPTLAAGASGAIFGMFGALIFFGINYPKVFMKTIGGSILSLLAINLAFGFILDGVDNAGHIGGLVGGFLISSIVSLPGKYQMKYAFGGLLAFIVSFIIILNQQLYIQSDEWKEASLIAISGGYIENESFEEIDELFTKYGSEHSENVGYMVIDAFIDIQLEKYGKAVETLEASLEIEPTGNAYYYLAFLYADLQE